MAAIWAFWLAGWLVAPSAGFVTQPSEGTMSPATDPDEGSAAVADSHEGSAAVADSHEGSGSVH